MGSRRQRGRGADPVARVLDDVERGTSGRPSTTTNAQPFVQSPDAREHAFAAAVGHVDVGAHEQRAGAERRHGLVGDGAVAGPEDQHARRMGHTGGSIAASRSCRLSLSGHTWLRSASASHRAARSATTSGRSDGEVACLGEVVVEAEEVPAVGVEVAAAFEETLVEHALPRRGRWSPSSRRGRSTATRASRSTGWRGPRARRGSANVARGSRRPRAAARHRRRRRARRCRTRRAPSGTGRRCGRTADGRRRASAISRG